MRREGFTLAEVVVVTGLIALVAAGLVHGIMTVNSLNYLSAQRVSAFGICRERFERMRASDFTELTATNQLFATVPVRITHLGGLSGVALTGTCSAVFTDFTGPVRKHIRVSVAWRFRERNHLESINGVIFDKRS